MIYFYLKNTWKPVHSSFIKKDNMLIIGHRGAPSLAHENTIESFQKAIESNINGIEMDVQYTIDNQIIVYHDWTCHYLKNLEKLIHKTSYLELKKINLKNKRDFKIPLFSEVLNILPKNYIKIVEIKSLYIKNTGFENQIIDILNQHNAINTSIISSFNPFVLRRIKKINPKIQTAFLWTRKKSQLIINTPLWIWWCKPDGFHCDFNFLDKKLINWIKQKNMSLFTYTIINKIQLNKAKKLGVNGIFVDDPFLQ